MGKIVFSMKYAVSILLLIIANETVQNVSVPEIATSPISEGIVYILNKFFMNSTKISINYGKQQSLMVSDLIRRTDMPVVMNADEGPQTETEEIDKRRPNDISVIMDDLINISKFLNNSKWTATTFFLLLITKSDILEKEMTDIFQQFWNKNIVNILLLVDHKSEVHFYSYIPFNKHDCAVHKPTFLAAWASGQLTTKSKFIHKDGVINLNGCRLNASVIHTPPSIIYPNEESKKGTKFVDGIEGLILMELSNRLNFKLNLAEPKDGKYWGEIVPNPEGAVGDLFLKKSHFAAGNFAYKPDRYKYLDMSVAISCEMESWAVPLGAKKTQAAWISLLVSGFQNDLWCLMFITIMCIMITFRILSKISIVDRYLFNGNIKIILYTFKSSLGIDVEEVPKSIPLKMLFLTWLLYCFVIVTAYQAVIGSKLTVPHRNPNINTFKDLVESDLLVTGLRSLFILLAQAQEEDEDIKAIGERFHDTPYVFGKVIDKLVNDKNIAYMGTMTKFMYIVLLHPEAKGLIHFVQQCVSKFHPIILFQKNCPFTARANKIIIALFESGIICKWRRQFVYDVPPEEPTVQKLSLDRMIGSFVILMVGLVVAFIVFLAERALYWYSSRRIRLRGKLPA